jgi:hypothetical protein
VQLLQTCKSVNPKIKWEIVSPSSDEDVEKYMGLVQKYAITGRGLLILYGPAGAEAKEFVKPDDLVVNVPDSRRDPMGGGMRQEFQGEYALIKTLRYLGEGATTTTVYFTQGNGELDVNDGFGRGRDQGAGVLFNVLKRGSFTLKPLPLDLKAIEDKKDQTLIPEDADMVIIAGPRQRFPKPAVEALGKYLKEGTGKKPGKAMILFDVEPGPDGSNRKTGLEDLVAEYNVKLGDNHILTARHNDNLLGGTPGIRDVLVIPHLRSDNPILTSFTSQGRASTVFMFYECRTVEPDPMRRNPGYSVEVLLDAVPSNDIWVETDMTLAPEQAFNALRQNRPELEKRLAKDFLPVAVAVTASNLPPGHPGIGDSGGQPRLIVVGDASWISNRGLMQHQANFELFSRSMDWLRERPVIGKTPDPPQRRTYDFSPSETTVWRLIWQPAVLMLLVVMASGIGVWLVRRR